MKFFNGFYDGVDDFFGSLYNFNFTFGTVLFFALCLFAIIFIIVLVSTAHSYEAQLIKSIDMLNSYFMDNPQITEDNLVAFNERMKSKKVPKQLRKQWQQYVLYRENKASYYMSFENCVSNPILNSTYKRDVRMLNISSYIIATLSCLLGAYLSMGGINEVFQQVLLAPAIILILNFLITIFFDARHNAIVSDLYQNYQYFEVNIDKATQTLPDYVDYEVLFDKNEIKRGIPMLYAYLQKRAEEEQRELDRARLKNIEHEKFNFDDAGVAESLVLDRAMQEAENYLAERKKYNEDTEQINNDISQEETNFREITKEYNRQLQVSKETFANFKAQLEEVSSSIEANYLKKQQQQELDRQRNLERDYDTASDRHKKIIEGFQEELDSVDKFREESKKNLEDAMKSEFESYSMKIYENIKKIVQQEQLEKFEKIKEELRQAEEKLNANGIASSSESVDENLDEVDITTEQLQQSVNDIISEGNNEDDDSNDEGAKVQDVDLNNETPDNEEYEEVEETEDDGEGQDEEYNEEENVEESEEFGDEYVEDEDLENLVDEDAETADEETEENAEFDDEEYEEVEPDAEEDVDAENFEEDNEEYADEQLEEAEEDYDEELENSTEESESEVPEGEMEQTSGEQKRRGRPRKVQLEKVKRGRGRPKKEVEEEQPTVKGKRGRPKKENKRGRGRPKKEEEVKTKRSVGRPKKETTQSPIKGKRGRPRKIAANVNASGKRGRPRKIETAIVKQSKAGRPRKVANPQDLSNIDAYLKRIDDEIAKENAKLEETRKELAQKSRIKGRR